MKLQSNVQGNILLWGERSLLGQAVANLLDNAIKFSPRDSTIELGFTEDAILSVADQGAGIPDHLKDKVGDRFFRLERNMDMPGHGLGLSMVNAIAEVHDATLTFTDNEPGLRVSMHFFNMKKI